MSISLGNFLSLKASLHPPDQTNGFFLRKVQHSAARGHVVLDFPLAEHALHAVFGDALLETAGEYVSGLGRKGGEPDYVLVLTDKIATMRMYPLE